MLRTSRLELTYELPQLLDHLEEKFYRNIETWSKSAARRIKDLDDDNSPQWVLHYIVDTQKLLLEISGFLRLRRSTLAPYVQELVEKKTDGHDCRNCSTSCTIRHASHAYEVKSAQLKVREALSQLQSILVPAKKETLNMTCFIALRREIGTLEILLAELFYLEEFTLLPRLIEVQTNIHAHS